MRNKESKLYHFLTSQQLDRGLLEELCSLADKVRCIAKSKQGMEFLAFLLNHKRAMLYFVQPSTRTFLSFLSACHILGIKCAEVRDTRTSSEVKGESEEDTVKTFSSYFDLIIMRHPKANFAERIAGMLDHSERDVPIVNAGSGKDQHPTQALLDIYTLQRCFKNRDGIDHKKIGFVGDLRRGRTSRSLSGLLRHYKDVKQFFVAPPEFQMGEDILALLAEAGIEYELTDNFDAVLPELDAIYMTRLQDEWDAEEGNTGSPDLAKYALTRGKLDLLKPDAVILHPLPRRQEISIEVDADPRALYWQQVRNGMWARVALIATIFNSNEEINDYYKERYENTF